MELKIFRDTLPQAGASCTVKAELPLETEILISDYLPPVFKLVKCVAKPVDGHGGRPDRISQLPGREPAPH